MPSKTWSRRETGDELSVVTKSVASLRCPGRCAYIDGVDVQRLRMRREADGGEQSLNLIPLQLSASHQLRQQGDTFARATGRQSVQQRLPVRAVTLASLHTSATSANAVNC